MEKIRGIEKHFPDFNDSVNALQEATMARLNCHNIGRVIEFDSATQTCTIQLMQLKQHGNNIYTPAPLTKVPLIIYGQGGAHITLPDPVGSICLVLFLDRNIDAFLETGEIYEPQTNRMHDFTDCVAITTFKTLVDSIEDYDTEAISISYQKIINEIIYNSVIKNYGNSIQLRVNAEENTTQIILNDKVNIQNTSQNLAALMQDLINTVKGLTVNLTTGAVTTGTQDALDVVAEEFSELLQ